jgi:ribosomal protein S9
MKPYVEELVARTVIGMVTPLRGAENMKDLNVYLEKGNVKITVNGNELAITEFPNDIIANTLTGLVSSLKEVEDIDSLDISVKVE